MKAAVFLEPQKPFVIKEIDKPKIGPEDVLVRVKASGICGGDLHRYSGSIKVEPLPSIIGHQVAGTIESIGALVPSSFKPNMNVVIHIFSPCLSCKNCMNEKDNLCLKESNYSYGGFYGGFAEYMAVPYGSIVKVPQNVPLVEASALVDSFATSNHAVKMARIKFGEPVVVFGIGDLGLAIIQLVKKGGGVVIAVDKQDYKLDLAKKIGADEVIDANHHNPLSVINKLTNKQGASIAFEVAGKVETTMQAIECVGRGGKVILVGATDRPISEFATMPYCEGGFALNKELAMKASWAMTIDDVKEVLDLRANHILDVKTGLIEMKLEEINEAFKLKSEGKLTRVILIP